MSDFPCRYGILALPSLMSVPSATFTIPASTVSDWTLSSWLRMQWRTSVLILRSILPRPYTFGRISERTRSAMKTPVR